MTDSSVRAIEAELGISKSSVHRVVNYLREMRERAAAEEGMLARAAAEEEARRLREEDLARERESLSELGEGAPEGGAQQAGSDNLTPAESPPPICMVKLPERRHQAMRSSRRITTLVTGAWSA